MKPPLPSWNGRSSCWGKTRRISPNRSARSSGDWRWLDDARDFLTRPSAGSMSLLRNPYFVVPLVAWVIAQASKVIIDSVLLRRLSVRRLATAGGMPSSHSALVVSLTTIIGRLQGVESPLFALALIFSSVVMYDATGVRRAAGQQAMILNRLLDDLFIAHRGIHQVRLRELLGHTPIEVIAGALLGIVIGLGLWR